MRFLFATLLGLLTTVMLAVTVTLAWTQARIVDENGFVGMSAAAAADPKVQHAIADELTAQIVSLAKKQGRRVDETTVADQVAGYTSGSLFRSDFASASRMAHQWLFTNSSQVQRDSQGRWQVDLAPMIRSLIPQGISIRAPESVKVAFTNDSARGLTPGRLVPVARFGPVVLWLVVGITAILVGLTQLAVRSRAKGIVGLGISVLLVGTAGWAGLEIGRRHLDRPLSRISDNLRQVADGVVNEAIGNAHQWLSLTMAVGGVLILLGVISAILGGLLRR